MYPSFFRETAMGLDGLFGYFVMIAALGAFWLAFSKL
jgi:hypothetical protein